MLFDCYQSGNGNFSNTDRLPTTTATSGVLAKSNTAEVAQRLYSGILGSPSTKMFPAMLTNGLRVELDLNSARKALQLWSGAGVCLDTGLAPMEAEESCFFGIQSCSGAGGAGAPLTQLDLYTEKDSIAVIFQLSEIWENHIEMLFTPKDVAEFCSSKIS